MRWQDWQPSRANELRVKQALKRLTQSIKWIVNIKGKSFIDMLHDIAGLSESPDWVVLANHVARQMVQNIAVQNARSWREAAKAHGKRGAEIHKILRSDLNTLAFKQLTLENARKIKALPSDIALNLTKKVSKYTVAGGRAENIEAELKKLAPHLSESHIRMLARTETSKTQAAINQTRAESVNADFYIWRTCENERVRESHRIMDGVLCRFSKPPAPERILGQKSTLGAYNPGCAPNCRCFAEIMLDLSEIQFPVKLAFADKIQKVNKKQFLLMIGPDLAKLTR